MSSALDCLKRQAQSYFSFVGKGGRKKSGFSLLLNSVPIESPLMLSGEVFQEMGH